MAEENDLARRVDALEDQGREMRAEIAAVRTDAAAARALASGADRDVAEVRAELRAHTSTLNALRETQLEQGQELKEHRRILGGHSRAFVNVQQGVDKIVDLLTEQER